MELGWGGFDRVKLDMLIYIYSWLCPFVRSFVTETEAACARSRMYFDL